MKETFRHFLHDESGASMVEYAILVALLSIAAVVIIVVIGQQVDSAYHRASQAIGAGGLNAP